MQVVVAKHRDSASTKIMYKSERCKRLRPPVHEIPNEPQSIEIAVKVNPLQQVPEGFVATLHIPDSVGCQKPNELRLEPPS
jgi:hypothetical protein